MRKSFSGTVRRSTPVNSMRRGTSSRCRPNLYVSGIGGKELAPWIMNESSSQLYAVLGPRIIKKYQTAAERGTFGLDRLPGLTYASGNTRC